MHPGHIARMLPNAPAIIMGERQISYAELDAASRRIAVAAREHGLVRGDVLAILAGNSPEFLTATWAAQRSGLYALPIGHRLTATEVAYILGDSAAALLVADGERDALARAACKRLGVRAPAAVNLRWDGALFCPDGAPPDPDPVEGGDMLYTSGTTGQPKGVRRALDFQPLGSAMARAERLQALFHMDAQTVFLSPAPLYHAAPLRFCMALLRIGGTLVLLPRFDPALALQTLTTTAVTHSQWVPTMFARLLALDCAQREAFSAPAHRVAIHAGAPCPPAVKRRMIEWWGPILHEYYSGTESVGFTHIDSQQWLAHPGSVGRPWNCKVHILDDQGRELPPGETGGVYFSGRGQPSYHNAPEKTAAALSAQGFATLGDLGYVDADGYLYLTDRRAFTIISGGVNIYPREIEDALQADSRVTTAAVFGTPDPDLGEAVTAVLQLAPGITPSLALARSLRDGLALTVARFKLPRCMAFCTEIPLTDSGKVHKSQLRQSWRDTAKLWFEYEELSGDHPCATP